MSNALTADSNLSKTAFSLYMAGFDSEYIADKLSLDRSSLDALILGIDMKGLDPRCWLKQRENFDIASSALYIKQKVDILEQTCGLSVELIRQQLKRYTQLMKEDPTMVMGAKELNALADIATKFDKISRLESGKSTENISSIALTPNDIKDIFDQNPLMKYISKKNEIELPDGTIVTEERE